MNLFDLGPDSSEYEAVTGSREQKRPAHPGLKAGAAGLKLFCAFPPPLERFAFLDLASDYARSRLDDGGG
jgi:hypothetical protein